MIMIKNIMIGKLLDQNHKNNTECTFISKSLYNNIICR